MMIVCDELSCSKFVHEFLNLIFLVLLGKTVFGHAPGGMEGLLN